MDAVFEISLVSVFQPQESDPVGIFKDFKIQLFCLGTLKLHLAWQSVLQSRTFSPSPSKKKNQKSIIVEKQGKVLCFLQRFEEGMNINTARNFLLVEGNLHRRSCCQFLCYNNIKISVSRDLENRLYPLPKVLFLKFCFLFTATNEAFSERRAFYVLHSVCHLACRK